MRKAIIVLIFKSIPTVEELRTQGAYQFRNDGNIVNKSKAVPHQKKASANMQQSSLSLFRFFWLCFKHFNTFFYFSSLKSKSNKQH